MKKYEGIITFSKSNSKEDVTVFVNDRINENLQWYRKQQLIVSEQTNYVTDISFTDDMILVSFTVEYETEKDNLDLDELIMGVDLYADNI